jgi:hypothetical protein
MLRDVQQCQKFKMKKRTTDAFQVFCIDKRQEITSLHPGQSVGAITSMLATIWRAMPSDQKISYAQIARQFDLSLNIQRPQTETVSQPKMDVSSITLPFIDVLQRNGCSAAPHQASMTLLNLVVQKKLTRATGIE